MTTKTALVRARIEPLLKKRAELVLHKIGISPSDAINVFYRRVADEQAVPFALRVPNRKTREVIQELRSGKGKTVSIDDFAQKMRLVTRNAQLWRKQNPCAPTIL